MSCPNECKGLSSSGSCKKDQACGCDAGSTGSGKPTFLGCMVGCHKWSDYFRYERITDYLHIPRGLEIKWGDVPGNRPYDDDLGACGQMSYHTYYSGSGDDPTLASNCTPCGTSRRSWQQRQAENDSAPAKEGTIGCDYVPPEMMGCQYEAEHREAERRENKRRPHHHHHHHHHHRDGEKKEGQKYMVYAAATSTPKRKRERKAIEPPAKTTASETEGPPPSRLEYQPSLYSQGSGRTPPTSAHYQDSFGYLPSAETLYYPRADRPFASADTLDYRTGDEGGSSPVASSQVFEYSPTETEPEEDAASGSYYSHASRSLEEPEYVSRSSHKEKDTVATGVPAYAVREIKRRQAEALQRGRDQSGDMWEGQYRENGGLYRVTAAVKGGGVALAPVPPQQRPAGDAASPTPNAKRPSMPRGERQQLPSAVHSVNLRPPLPTWQNLNPQLVYHQTVVGHSPFAQLTKQSSPLSQTSSQRLTNRRSNSGRSLSRQSSDQSPSQQSMPPRRPPSQPSVYLRHASAATHLLPVSRPTNVRDPTPKNPLERPLIHYQSTASQTPFQHTVNQRLSSGHSTNAQSPSGDRIVRQIPSPTLVYHQPMPSQHLTLRQSPPRVQSPMAGHILNRPLVYRQENVGRSPFELQSTQGQQGSFAESDGNPHNLAESVSRERPPPNQNVAQTSLNKSPSFEEYEGMSATEERKIVHFLRRLLSLPRVDSASQFGDDDENADVAEYRPNQVIMLTREIKKRLKMPTETPTAGIYVPTRDYEKANPQTNQETHPPQFVVTSIAETRRDQPEQTRGYTSDQSRGSDASSKHHSLTSASLKNVVGSNCPSLPSVELRPTPSTTHTSTRTKSSVKTASSTSKHEDDGGGRSNRSAASFDSSVSFGTEKTTSGRTFTQGFASSSGSFRRSGSGGTADKHRRAETPKRAPSPDDVVAVRVTPVYLKPVQASDNTNSSSFNPTSDDEVRSFSSLVSSNVRVFEAGRPTRTDGGKETRRKKCSFDVIAETLGLAEDDKDTSKDKSFYASPNVLDMNLPSVTPWAHPFSKAAEHSRNIPGGGNVADPKSRPPKVNNEKTSTHHGVKSAPSSVRRFEYPKFLTGTTNSPSRTASPSRQSFIGSLASRQNLATPVRVIKPQVGTLYSPHKYIIARPVTFTTVSEQDVRWVTTSNEPAGEVTRLYENDRASRGSTTARRESEDGSTDLVIREERFVATSAPRRTDAAKIVGRFFESHEKPGNRAGKKESASHQSRTTEAKGQQQQLQQQGSSLLNVIAEETTGEFVEEERIVPTRAPLKVDAAHFTRFFQRHNSYPNNQTADAEDRRKPPNRPASTASDHFIEEERVVATRAPLKVDSAQVSRFFERHNKLPPNASPNEAEGGGGSEWRMPPVLSLHVIPEESRIHLPAEDDSSETVNVFDISDTSLVAGVLEATEEVEPKPTLSYLSSRIMKLQRQIHRLEKAFIELPVLENRDHSSDEETEKEASSPSGDEDAVDADPPPPPLVGNQSSLFAFINSLSSPSFDAVASASGADADAYGTTNKSLMFSMPPAFERPISSPLIPKPGEKRKLDSDETETKEKKSPKKGAVGADPPPPDRKGRSTKRDTKRPSARLPLTKVNTVVSVATPGRDKSTPPRTVTTITTSTTFDRKKKKTTPTSETNGRPTRRGNHDQQVFSLYSILTTGTLSCKVNKTPDACKPPSIEAEDVWNGSELKLDVRNRKRAASSLDSVNKDLLRDIISLGKEEKQHFSPWSFNVPLLTVVNRNGNFYEDSSDEEVEPTNGDDNNGRDRARIMWELEKQRLELVEMKRLLSQCVARMDTAKREASRRQPLHALGLGGATHHVHDVRSASCSHRSGEERSMFPRRLRSASDHLSCGQRQSKVSSLHLAEDSIGNALVEDEKLKREEKVRGFFSIFWQKSNKKELHTNGIEYERVSFSGSFIERIMSFFNPKGYARRMSRRENSDPLRPLNDLGNALFQSNSIDNGAISYPGEIRNTKLIGYNSNAKSNSSLTGTKPKRLNNESVGSQKAHCGSNKENGKVSGCCAWLRIGTNGKRQNSRTSSAHTVLTHNSKGIGAKSNGNDAIKGNHDSLEKDFSSELFLSQAILEPMADAGPTHTYTRTVALPSRVRDPVDPNWRNVRLGTTGPGVSSKLSPSVVYRQQERRLDEAFRSGRPNFTYRVNYGTVKPKYPGGSDQPQQDSQPQITAQDSHAPGPSETSATEDPGLGTPSVPEVTDHPPATSSQPHDQDNTAQTQSRGVLYKRHHVAKKKGEHGVASPEEKPKSGFMHHPHSSKGSAHDGDERQKSSHRFNILGKRDGTAPHPGGKKNSRVSLFSRSSASTKPADAEAGPSTSFKSSHGGPERKKSISQRLGVLMSKVHVPHHPKEGESKRGGRGIFSKKGEHSHSEKVEAPRKDAHPSGGANPCRRRSRLSQRIGAVMNKVHSTKSKESSKSSNNNKPSVSHEQEVAPEEIDNTTSVDHENNNGVQQPVAKSHSSKRSNASTPNESESAPVEQSATPDKHEVKPEASAWLDSAGPPVAKEDAEHGASVSHTSGGQMTGPSWTNTSKHNKTERRPLVKKPYMKHRRSKSSHTSGESSGGKSRGSSRGAKRKADGGRDGKNGTGSKLCKLCLHYLCGCLLH